MRVSGFIWIFLVALAGYAMFQVKYEVSRLDTRLAAVNHQIADDQDRIHALKAEWAVLTQPKRLEELAKKAALPLEPIGTKMLGALDKPPMRPVPVAAIEPDRDGLAQIAEAAMRGGR